MLCSRNVYIVINISMLLVTLIDSNCCSENVCVMKSMHSTR